uniref:Chromosome 3 open reading frame 18 n=1 Tax=Cercocebus atys TaxID=9531 RepID=A0A2K5NKB3_CERAT
MCLGLTPGDPDLLVFLKITSGIWLQPKGIAPSWLLGTEPGFVHQEEEEAGEATPPAHAHVQLRPHGGTR